MSRATRAAARGWRARRPLRVGLITVGLVGMVASSWAVAQLRRALPFGVPLAAPSSLAVDDEGRVYVGTAVDRIHVYGRDGSFLRGWQLDRDAGRVRVRIAASERIEIATERSGRLHAFDRDGRLLDTRADPEAFERFGSTHDRVAEGPGGTRVELESGALWRTAPSPPALLAPPVGPPLAWFARSPVITLPAVLVTSALAILAGVLLSTTRRRGSPAGPR